MAKLIKAVFGAGQMSRTCPQWQYDYNTILQFVGLDLPATFEVDLANSKTGQSTTVLGDADGCCTIPAQYFIPGTSIFAWAYIVDSNSGYTRCQVEIPIHPRAQHTGDPPTPEQQSALDQAIALLNAATENIPNEINAALEAAKESGEFDGEDGTSPGVTITEIEGGHRITITDEAHPDGQRFDVMDGTGGGVTVDDALSGSSTNPVQNKVIKAALDGKGTYSKPSGGIPASDLAEDAQRGYTVEETRTVIIPEQTVTTALSEEDDVVLAELTLASGLTYYPKAGDTLSVTINGETKEIVGQSAEGSGQVHFVFSGDIETPFDTGLIGLAMIDPSGGPSYLVTIGISPATYTISAELVTRTMTVSPEFQEARGYVVDDATKGEVTTTPDFDAAVKKASAEALAEKLDTDGDAYRAVSLPMGHLDSTSTATVMTAQVPGITELRDGVCVWLENGVIASASGVTLNINSLGAKPIYNSLSGTVVTTTFVAASTYLFVYNATRVTGGCWDMVYGYDANTTYTPVKLGFGYATCSTAEATAAKTAALSSYTLTTGGIVAVKFTNAVPAGATLNINSKGAKAIYYKGAAITDGVIKAGDTVTMIYSTYYHVLSIDRDMDTLPPSPSNNDPVDISTVANAGTSPDYARADHVHNIDLTYLKNCLFDIYAENLPVFLYDGQNGVYIPYGPQVLANAALSQVKINLALVVPPNYNNYPVLFTMSKFDTTTGELHLTGIVGGVLYEATLLPGADPTGQSSSPIMVGTMTTTNLTLPSAQGVSF